MTSFLNDPDSDWDPLCECVEPALLVGVGPTTATEDTGGWWDLTTPLFNEEGAPNGQWYYRVYVYSSDINTCAQFIELDLQGISPAPAGNRSKFQCGVAEVIHGLGYGEGECVWRIDIRCYGDTGIRVKIGADC